MPWIVLALAMIVVIAALAYRDVKVSARLLGIALILEVIMLVIFSLGVIFAHGGTNFSGDSLNMFKVFTPVAEQTVGTVAIPAGAAAVVGLAPAVPVSAGVLLPFELQAASASAATAPTAAIRRIFTLVLPPRWMAVAIERRRVVTTDTARGRLGVVT